MVEHRLRHNPRGLTTGPIPAGDRVFSIDLGFDDRALLLQISDGSGKVLALIPRAVADFYRPARK